MRRGLANREKNVIAMWFSPRPHLRGLNWWMLSPNRKRSDTFRESILAFELGRLGSRGYFYGLLAGGVIGFLPILNHGSPIIKLEIILGFFH